MFKITIISILLNILMSSAHGSVPITQKRSGLPNVFARLKAGKPTVIAYLGGSITAGSGSSDAARKSWRALTTAWFTAQYPKTKITEVDASIGGTGSELGVFRLQKDVLDKKPDLVFVEFAVNDDILNQLTGQSMEGIVRKIIAADPKTDICFVYTIHDRMRTDLNAGKLFWTMQLHETIADRYGIPSVNMGAAALDDMNAGKIKWEEFTVDGCHPTDAGYLIYSKTLAAFLASEAESTQTPRKHKMAAPLYKDSLQNAVLVEIKPVPSAPQWQPEVNPPINILNAGLSCSAPGAEIVLPFKGRVIGYIFTLGPDTGNLDYKIDNGEYQVVAPYDAWSYFYRIGYRILSSTLTDTAHTLTIRVRSDKDPASKGTVTRIHYLMVNGKQ